MRPLRSHPRILAVALAAVLVVLAAGGVAAWAMSTSLPPVTGVQLDRPVPDLGLVESSGHATSLSALKGRYVVLAPFLTLCHEVCPITTGAYIEMRRAVEQAGLGDRVTFVEATVDPGRDTPARLRAFAQLTGSDWTLLTGSSDQIGSLWKFFDVGYQTQPIGSPAPLDWWTHQPETYDVGHTDALFIIDPNGHERIAVVGIADVGGKLNSTLTSLLDEQGLQNLRQPQAAWTIPQALDDLGHLMGRRIAAAGS